MYPLALRPDARLNLLSKRLFELEERLVEKYPEIECDFEEPNGHDIDESFFSDDLLKECQRLTPLYFSERNLLYYNPNFHHWLIGKPALQETSEEFHRLESHSPNHPLLRYFSEISSERFVYSQDGKTQREFMIAYNNRFLLVDCLFYNYSRHLRSVSDKIEGIGRSPKPKKIGPINNLENLSEIDDVPF